MKAFLTLVLLAFVAALPASAESHWYREGKLKDATVGLWRNATPAQRLATCADWISTWDRQRMSKPDPEGGTRNQRDRNFNQLRKAAEDLRREIDERLVDYRADRPVFPIATDCARDLGILRY